MNFNFFSAASKGCKFNNNIAEGDGVGRGAAILKSETLLPGGATAAGAAATASSSVRMTVEKRRSGNESAAAATAKNEVGTQEKLIVRAGKNQMEEPSSGSPLKG